MLLPVKKSTENSECKFTTSKRPRSVDLNCPIPELYIQIDRNTIKLIFDDNSSDVQSNSCHVAMHLIDDSNVLPSERNVHDFILMNDDKLHIIYVNKISGIITSRHKSIQFS